MNIEQFNALSKKQKSSGKKKKTLLKEKKSLGLQYVTNHVGKNFAAKQMGEN